MPLSLIIQIILLIIRFLPLRGSLSWIKSVVPAVIASVEALPREEREAAKSELIAAAQKARKTGDANDLAMVLRKRCIGSACPSDTV